MLNRNCAINNLLEEGDYNVRVTAFDASTHTFGAWIETIRDSIGGGIVNSTGRIKLIIKDEFGKQIISGITTGNLIADIIRGFYTQPVGLRISIAPASDTSRLRTWIFV